MSYLKPTTMAEKNSQTVVTDIEADIEELLAPGAESIMTPGEEGSGNRNVFTDLKPDTSFLDKPDSTPVDDDPIDPANPEDLDEPGDEPDPLAPEAPKAKNKPGNTGRPKSVVSVFSKLIEKGTLIPFDDGKDINQYNEEDFVELLEANLEHNKSKVSEDTVEQIFSQLPDEMQYLYEYISKGGKDIKGAMRSLSTSAEIRDLDPNDEHDSREIVRTYYAASGWTSDEIEDEIASLEDMGQLGKKAKQFKPKLDSMQQQIINQRLAAQEEAAKKRQKQSQIYIDNVYNTLEAGELNGIKLSNKVQNMLYTGLVQPNYPSVSGGKTNLLGHLLEKYQWVEPRHDLIAEALYLLADPEGYRNTIRTTAVKETNEKTMRTLKTEQNNNRGMGTHTEDDDDTRSPRRQTLQRPQKNFFTRG